MAPEILRYEKYDAKADLWSVGAVLFEMTVGRPPFRANNHVELLRKIEKGEDRIRFPDELSKPPPDPQALPVSDDIKALIRGLLKRQPGTRMGFDDFFSCGVWDGHMHESRLTEDESEGMSYDTSTDSSAMGVGSERVREMLETSARVAEARALPTRAPQPLSVDPALNPQPAPRPVDRPTVAALAPLAPRPRPVLRQTEPKYYVSDDRPTDRDTSAAHTPTPPNSATPLPIARPAPAPTPVARRVSPRDQTANRDTSSVEETQPLTPSSNPPPQLRKVVGEGSPLAATPPITFVTGKDESALEGEDSVVGREYVVVEKRTVEVNALADGELAPAY